MKFTEIANRLTGISTPLLGVSWQPNDLEVSAARRVIAFLEDRRVLYAPDELEVPDHCVHSVLEIRHFLSGELGKLDTKSEFAASLRAMRAACRKFLDRVGVDGREVTCTPTITATGRAGPSTAPWVRCGVRSGSTWRRSPPSSSWTLRIVWPKSCLPRLPIRTMRTVILPAVPASDSRQSQSQNLAAYGVGCKG